jgi:CRP-like cAMP-binding protein
MGSEMRDLRGMPPWERAAQILQAFDRLSAGEFAVFVTDNEPRGLAARVEQSLQHEAVLIAERVADREWRLHLKRSVNGAIDATQPAAVLARVFEMVPLAPQWHERLAAVSSMHAVRRGEVVRPEGEDWPFLGIVTEGTLALASGNGSARQRIFYEVFPYDIFGETEFFDGARAAARVIVLSKSARYLRLPREAVREAGLSDPQLLEWIGRIAVQRVRNLIESLVDQSSSPIIVRVSQVLLRYAIADRGLQPAMAPLPNMTQTQIAAAAGTVKEVAARAISDLEERGLLKRERGHVKYLDRQGLIELIESETR